MNSLSAKGWTFICLPVVWTKTDGREEEVRNEMCPQHTQGRLQRLIHFSVARQPPPSGEPKGMRPAGKFACMLIDLFDFSSRRFSAGVTFFGPWQAIDMSGSILVIVFPETGGLLILWIDNGTHFSLTRKQTESFSASLASMAGIKCLSLLNNKPYRLQVSYSAFTMARVWWGKFVCV